MLSAPGYFPSCNTCTFVFIDFDEFVLRVCYVLDAKIMKAWPSLQKVAAAIECEAVTITQREQCCHSKCNVQGHK